jgi:hypothetical protein
VFDPFERTIRRTLRALSRQRVRMILQPGYVFVIDNALDPHPDAEAALKTCWLRGWVELVDNAIPSGRVTPEGAISDPPFTGSTPMYRITDSGWSVIRRSHTWTVVAVWMAFLSVCAGLLGGFVLQMLARP